MNIKDRNVLVACLISVNLFSADGNSFDNNTLIVASSSFKKKKTLDEKDKDWLPSSSLKKNRPKLNPYGRKIDVVTLANKNTSSDMAFLYQPEDSSFQVPTIQEELSQPMVTLNVLPEPDILSLSKKPLQCNQSPDIQGFMNHRVCVDPWQTPYPQDVYNNSISSSQFHFERKLSNEKIELRPKVNEFWNEICQLEPKRFEQIPLQNNESLLLPKPVKQSCVYQDAMNEPRQYVRQRRRTVTIQRLAPLLYQSRIKPPEKKLLIDSQSLQATEEVSFGIDDTMPNFLDLQDSPFVVPSYPELSLTSDQQSTDVSEIFGFLDQDPDFWKKIS